MIKDKERLRQVQHDWYVRNKARQQSQHRESYLNRRALHLCWEAKRRATRKGVPYTLNADDVVDVQHRIDLGFCEITGTPFNMDGTRKFNSPSIDRIVPKLGYVRGNIRVICRAMNIAMSNWGEDDVWEMFQNWQSVRPRLKRSSKRTLKP